jgi:hypothetical protein
LIEVIGVDAIPPSGRPEPHDLDLPAFDDPVDRLRRDSQDLGGLGDRQ